MVMKNMKNYNTFIFESIDFENIELFNDIINCSENSLKEVDELIINLKNNL